MDIIENLAEQILEYQSDLDWYGLCDDYGNIETEPEARKQVLEEIINTLHNNPEDIINMLKENIEELQFNEDYEYNDIYNKTKELIIKIEAL